MISTFSSFYRNLKSHNIQHVYMGPITPVMPRLTQHNKSKSYKNKKKNMPCET